MRRLRIHPRNLCKRLRRWPWAKRRLQKAEGDFRELHDEDMERRWGQVGSLEGYETLVGRIGDAANSTIGGGFIITADVFDLRGLTSKLC